MQAFECSVCGQLLFFDNSRCLRCRSALGFLSDERRLVALTIASDGALIRADGVSGRYRYCGNQLVARCNWLLPADSSDRLCTSCRLTSVRPHDDEVDAMAAFADAEAAKRRLVDQMFALGLPIIDRTADPERGVTFELLSSRGRTVTTGHEGGVITLDLSESDDAHREFVRQQLGEPYRTVLGHLRHEIAHYLWPLLVVETELLDKFRQVFGDETVSYQEALERHYRPDAPNDDGWRATHVSQYATMHPWEDWAETFAHYLHIVDGLETAKSFGIEVAEPARSAVEVGEPARSPVYPRVSTAFAHWVADWLVVTMALNAISRSIGQNDLYPFVLSQAVVDKLYFVHQLVGVV